MPATTPVYSALAPPRRTRIMSPFGPLAFLRTPSTSTSIASGLTPWNTVYATPFIPAWIWLTAMVGTGLEFSAFPAREDKNKQSTHPRTTRLMKFAPEDRQQVRQKKLHFAC